MSFPLTHEQMESWTRDQRFLTNANMELHLQDQKFVTSRDMSQFVTRLVNEFGPEQFQTRQAVQELFDRTVKLNNVLDGKVAARCLLFEGRQSEVMAAMDSRDAQFREHLDS